MNLTSRRLEAHGLYLIEDGQNMFLWLGKNAVPALVNDAFGLNSYEEVRAGKVRNSSLGHEQSLRDIAHSCNSTDNSSTLGKFILSASKRHHWQNS